MIQEVLEDEAVVVVAEQEVELMVDRMGLAMVLVRVVDRAILGIEVLTVAAESVYEREAISEDRGQELIIGSLMM